MNFEELSPELHEKAKGCKSTEELFQLAKQEGIEISEQELEAISGGWGSDKDCRRICDITITPV